MDENDMDVPDPFEEEGSLVEISDEEAAGVGSMFADESGQVPDAMTTAVLFLEHARGGDNLDGVPPLEDLVTAESLPNWNMIEVREALQGYGLASNVRYLSPLWALVLLPRVDDAQIRIATGPVPMISYGIFLRFDDESRDWRVHLLGPPDTDVADLP